jgi:tetratricopeptide (TPR) repeat protein
MAAVIRNGIAVKVRRKQNTTAPIANTKRPPLLPLRHLLAATALCAAALIAYANSFQAGFTLDNKILLLQDPRIRDASAGNIGLIFQHTYWWPHGESYLYRPFATLSYLFNYAVLGNADHVAGYHSINLLLHAVNVLLAYSLAHRLIRRFWPAVFVAGLWAVHPVLTESVTNIVGRPDLLAAGSILSGLLMALKAVESTGARRAAWLAGMMAAAAIGVFSKESAVAIVGIIAVYALVWWKEGGYGRKLLWSCLAAAPAFAALWYLRTAALAGSPPARFPFTDNPLVAADFWTARLTALKVMGLDLWLMIWPAQLSSDYSYAQIPLMHGSLRDWLAWLSVAAALLGVAIIFRRKQTAFFFALFGLVTFLPASNLIVTVGTVRAERVLYLPALGLTACLVLSIYAASSRIGSPQLAPILLAVIATGFVVRTWVRNSDWRNDLTLAAATVRTSPMSYKAHALLADALYQADTGHSNIGRVIEEAEKSVAPLDALPDLENVPTAYLALGQYYLTQGDVSSGRDVPAYRRAVQAFQRSIAIYKASDRQHGDPASSLAVSSHYVDACGLLSTAWLRLGEDREAFDAAIWARSLDPDNPEVYRQIVNVLMAGGHPEQATEKLMEGAIATADPGLRADLLKLYKNGGDPKGCAILTDASGSAINPSCETVHRDICSASAEIIKLRTQTGRKDLADETRNTATTEFGCPAAELRSP